MIKKIIIACCLSFSFLSFTAFALPKQILSLFVATRHQGCPPATATTDPGFCASFRTAATCRCVASGLPDGMCQDMNALYDRMVSIFGSQDAACKYQQDTTYQTCMDDWNCYRLGGRDSQGGLCSSTGSACQ